MKFSGLTVVGTRETLLTFWSDPDFPDHVTGLRCPWRRYAPHWVPFQSGHSAAIAHLISRVNA